MEEIQIRFRKIKIIFTIIGSLLFVLIGVWFLISFTELQISFSLVLIKIAGVVSVLFFGTTMFYGIKKYFDKKPGLIINKHGIIDNSNGTSVGLIEWNDITKIRIIEIMRTKSILLDTDKPEKYIAKAKPFQAKIMRANMKIYGTPLSIAPQTLQMPFDELNDLLFEQVYLNKQ